MAGIETTTLREIIMLEDGAYLLLGRHLGSYGSVHGPDGKARPEVWFNDSDGEKLIVKAELGDFIILHIDDGYRCIGVVESIVPDSNKLTCINRIPHTDSIYELPYLFS